MRLLTAIFLVWLILAVFALRAGATPPPAPDGEAAAPPQTPPTEVVLPVQDSVARLELVVTKRRLAVSQHRVVHLRRQLAGARRRWRPTVDYAIRLAAAVSGVPMSELYAVARCESGLYPFATNGQYKGLFQVHWAPFGFSPFDPVANALSAAFTVRRDGGWRQWECKP